MKLLFLLLFISLFSCSPDFEMTGNLSCDCNKILETGMYNVKIFENISVKDPKYLEINKKLTIAIQENYEWFIEFSENNEKPLPYNEKFGVSESEYYDYIDNSYNNLELEETGEAKVEIINEDNIVNFKGYDNLEFMDNVKINLNDSTIFMTENTLSFERYIIVDSTNNIFKSKWKGYNWEFSEGVSVENITTLNYNMKYYSITIGYLEEDKKTFMIIEGKQIENGVTIVDFNAPVILEKI